MESRDITHFKWWTVEFIASLVVISALYDEFTETYDNRWILSSSVVSAIISIIGLLSCIIPQNRSECSLESILVWLIAILRATTTIVAIIGRSLWTSDKEFRFYRFLNIHPNVYFFSLWALMASLLMLASWSKEFVNRGNEWSASSQWILLGAMSIFTMLSALVFKDETLFAEFSNPTKYNITKSDLVASIQGAVIEDGTMSNIIVENGSVGNLMIETLTNSYIANNSVTLRKVTDPAEIIFKALLQDGVLGTSSPCGKSYYSCFRINYIIGLSAATAAVACTMAPLKRTSRTCHIDVTVVLYLLWLCSLPILTVSPGPATSFGNLYIGINICFFLMHRIFISSITYRGSTKTTKNENANNAPIERGDLWQAAYGKLERGKNEEKGRCDSYESLFEPPEIWDDWDDWDEENAAEVQKHAHKENNEYSFTTGQLPGRKLNKDIYISSFNVTRRLFLKRDENEFDSSSDRQAHIEPREWKRRADRLSLWSMLLAVSIVVIHTIPQYKPRLNAYIVTSTSIFISCVGIVTCLRTSKVASILQTLSITIAFANWAYGAVLFLEEVESHDFGYSSAEVKVHVFFGEKTQRATDDPNVFFGVWISVITVVLLTTNGCKASLTTTDWLLFAIAGAALLVSSTDYTDEREDVFERVIRSCETEYSINCNKLIFTKYLAMVTLGISLLMTLLFRLGPTMHVISSIPLVIAWGFGVIYVTYDDTESIPVGIYFAFWGGVFLSLEIASINIIGLRRNRKQNRDTLNDSKKDDEGACAAEMRRETLPQQEIEIPDFQDLQRHDDSDSGVLSKIHEDGSKNEIESTKDKHSGDASQFFFDDIEPQDENLRADALMQPPQSNTRNFNHHQQHEISAASIEFVDCCEYNENRDRDHCLTENGLPDQPKSQMRSSIDDNQQCDDKSVDTDDFLECAQFENSSLQFHSARSTNDA